jgi:NADH-quinone oxidoreductase subunit H
MWVKYSLPRVRIDHMLGFCWKFLTPLSLALVMVTAILAKVLQDSSTWVIVLVFTLTNILIITVTVAILNRYSNKGRQKVAEPRPVAISPENRVSEIP